MTAGLSAEVLSDREEPKTVQVLKLRDGNARNNMEARNSVLQRQWDLKDHLRRDFGVTSES